MRPYTEAAPIAAFFLGVSSGFPYAMIGATLTTRLAQEGITKSTVTTFTLAFLVYNLKFLWAWVVDGVRLPIPGRIGQRVSWLIFAGVLVMAAVANLAFQDPSANIYQPRSPRSWWRRGRDLRYRHRRLQDRIARARQLGVGSGHESIWLADRLGRGRVAGAGAGGPGGLGDRLLRLHRLRAARDRTGVIMGEPRRTASPRPPRASPRPGLDHRPFLEFFRRRGAFLVLLFILLHKVGDTLGQLVLRLLLDDMGYTNDEIAIWDVGVGFWAYLIGIAIGGILYAQIGMKRSVLLALILMGVSNATFAFLAMAGHTNLGLAGCMFFENFASGVGGVVVVAYFSALCDLRFTATQYALISASASVVGRVLTGTTAGSIVEAIGFVNFYWLTTLAAWPASSCFWLMMRAG